MTDGTASRGTPSQSTRWAVLIAMLVTLVVAGGCASTDSRQFSRELSPLVGNANKAYFLEKYGDPDKRTVTDATTDVWEYIFGQERLNEYASRGNLTTATQLRLTFRNGILSSWQASNILK